MAERILDTGTECEHISVETDAAPSTDYVNLASLDIGSECTVVTEPKEDKKHVITIPEEETHEGQEHNYSQCQANYDIETGVKSLNLGQCIDQRGDGDTDAAESVIHRNVDEIENREYIDELATLCQQDCDGDTVLHNAIIALDKDRAILINVLTSINYNRKLIINIQNNLGQTPLHLAVLTKQNDIVRQLIMGGASLSYREQFLRTPMHIACEQNDLSMVETLCLDDSWLAGNTETTSRLLDPVTHPLNLPNADGERCLHLAVRHNNIEISRTLIENGADVNLPDRRSGRAPLHVAADLGHVGMARFLTCTENIDINQKTYNEETALEIAHMRGREEVVALLKPLSFPMMKRKSKSDG